MDRFNVKNSDTNTTQYLVTRSQDTQGGGETFPTKIIKYNIFYPYNNKFTPKLRITSKISVNLNIILPIKRI